MCMMLEEDQFVQTRIVTAAVQRISFEHIVRDRVVLVSFIHRFMVPRGHFGNYLRWLLVITSHVAEMFLLVVVVHGRIAFAR